eukprot:4012136-Pyramimonas_sp.AAC.1
MAAGPKMNEDGKSKKQQRCALADRTGIHGYWNALDDCHERFKSEERPDPRMNMTILPDNVPRPEYRNAVEFIGKALACIIWPEAVTSFARFSFPQACAALSSVIRAAGISSRIS